LRWTSRGREHERIAERLKEGDKELQQLGRGKESHSDRIEQIEKQLEAASTKRWDVAQIVISAVVGLVVSGITAAVGWALLLHKFAAAAAAKGGTP
jgi:chromosome segregation ATPase